MRPVTSPKAPVCTAVGPRGCHVAVAGLNACVAAELNCAAACMAFRRISAGLGIPTDNARERIWAPVWPGFHPRSARKRWASTTRGGSFPCCCTAFALEPETTRLCARICGVNANRQTASAHAARHTRRPRFFAPQARFSAPQVLTKAQKNRTESSFVTLFRNPVPASSLKVPKGRGKNPLDYAKRNKQFPGMELWPIIGL